LRYYEHIEILTYSVKNSYKFLSGVSLTIIVFILSSSAVLATCDIYGPQEELDRCLIQQRAQDQAVRDQLQIDADSAAAIFQANLNYFNQLNTFESQIDLRNSGDAEYVRYRFASGDCLQSARIPANPATIDSTLFYSLLNNKERCVTYLNEYNRPATPVTPTAPLTPVKSADQICSEKFGSDWVSNGINSCGCRAGLVQSNGICVSKDQSCNESFPNTRFLNVDSSTGRNLCECRDNYSWNSTRTKCDLFSTNADNCGESSRAQWNG
jgi:hypothetical protein